MTQTFLRGLAFAAALAAASAGAALAQPAGPPAAERGGPGMMGHRHMDPAKITQRLRDILQLRPNQEPALAALVEAMKPPEGMRERMMSEHQAMRSLSTPERLDRMRDNMVRRQGEFDRRAMAVKRFYAQLTPAQQKAFDALHPMIGHRRGGPMGGRMGGRMGGGMGGHAPG